MEYFGKVVLILQSCYVLLFSYGIMMRFLSWQVYQKFHLLVNDISDRGLDELEIIFLLVNDESRSKRFDIEHSVPRRSSRNLRAVYEPLIQAHFGDAIINNLFSKFSAKISQYHGKIKDSSINNLVVSLSKIWKRKNMYTI